MTDVKVMELHEWTATDLEEFANLLIDVVENGASIGFLPPLSEAAANAYWQSVLAPDVKLWAAYVEGALAGTIQLHLCTKPNGTHRAEIAKLMVHTNNRRQGIARKLMDVAEQAAMDDHRTLLVLDTREGDPSNDLYLSLGYVEAGRIPSFARSANGELHTTVLYYKTL